MLINIIGWYDKNNCGDESFRFVFNDIFQNHDIKYTCQEIIDGCDHYILGGGDLVKNFYLDNIPNDIKLNCIGVGISYENEAELLLSKNINLSYVRNKIDSKILNDLGIKSEYTPDIVFHLSKPEIIETLPITGRKKMALILSDHINPSVANTNLKMCSYYEFLKWELAETLDEIVDYDLYFISLSDYYYAYDGKINLDVCNRMQNGYKATHINENKDPLKLMSILQQMDVIVSMKFHGLIFSTICHVPFINIGVTRKTQTYCEEMNLQDLSITPKTFNSSDFIKLLRYVEENTQSIVSRLKEVDTNNKNILYQNIQSWKEEMKL